MGYYVNNDYQMPELSENPPPVTNFDLLVRSILAEEPRVTRFAIPWDIEDNPDLIPEDEVIDQDRMDVSGDDADEEEKIDDDPANENGGCFAENDDVEDEEDDEDDDIENIEHDLEEDEEKFKQKRHSAVNNVNMAMVFARTQGS